VNNSLKLEVLSESSDHDWLIPHWDLLVAENAASRLFDSPLWVMNYWKYRCQARGDVTFLTSRADDGRVVGILPLVKRANRWLPFLATWECAHSTGEYETNWICHPDYADQFASAVLDYLNRNRRFWYQFRMAAVREGSSALSTFQAQCKQSRFTFSLASAREVPFITLTEASSLDALVDGKYRRELRRRQGKLEQIANLDFTLHRDPKGLNAALDEFFSVEASGWKGRGGGAIQMDLPAEQFWRNLSQRAAEENRLRLHLLRLGDDVIAGQLGIVFGRTYYCLKLGYDEKYKQYGPGALTTRNVIQHCIEDPDVDVYDFSGAAMPYMSNWTTRTYQTWTAQVGSPHMAMRSLFNMIECCRTALRPVWRAFKSIRKISAEGNARVSHVKGQP
jgi:CelD/BcsL family acetyltransferase involved in cellulose biosynthesis